LYSQFAIGSAIPPSSVFDTTGAQVAVLPKPTSVKTYQAGSVVKFNRWTLDLDAYYSHFQNPYSSFFDPKTTESYFFQTGPSNTKGVEAETNFLIGRGLSLYLNATLGKAAYQNTGLWVQNTPRNTEAAGLTYRHKGWDVGFIDKRVGPMWNDNGTNNQAIPIEPFNVANAFFNYTVRGDSWLRGTKLRFGVNNLQNNHNIVGINAASTASNAAAAGDILTIMPARSVSVTMTFGYAPGR
jgi:iron complex outermembrane receptor protein